VGDVCGKGVGAALFMTLFRSLLRAPFTSDIARPPDGVSDASPSGRLQQVVSFTSNYVADTHAEANMFATLFMGIFDPGDGTLTYVNCGNEAPLLLSGDSMTALGPTGPVIGVIPGAAFGVRQIILQKGDLLVAFTDGITDATNARDEIFGRERLSAAIGQSATSPAALIASLESQLAEFVASAPQFDDITLLAIQRRR
jgi:sigma-B regulation protein RsbU (phosphoserine phosphatase)